MSNPNALLVTSSFLPGRGGIESYLAGLCSEVAPRLAVLAPAVRDEKALPHGIGAGNAGGNGDPQRAVADATQPDRETGARPDREPAAHVPAPEVPYATVGYERQMVLPGGGLVDAIDRAGLELGIDRILFGTPWPLSLVMPRVAARGYTYGSIVYAAELYVPTTVPGLRGFMLRALSGSDFIVTVSHYTTRRLTKMLERRSLRIPPMERLPARVDPHRFHPAVATEQARAELGLIDDDRVVLCFGRLVTRKGIHRVIDALPEITRRVPEAVLVIAGAGPEQDNLRKQAAATGDRVVFAGRVPEEKAPAYFALADVFTLPVADRYFGREVEGLGVVMLEAAACGTPSVIGRSGGSPETVVDGETGYVVDARNRAELADRIAALLGDPEESARMGAMARTYVDKEFTSAPLPDPLTEWLGG